MPAADIVSALNRMLESGEQRERYRMSSALAMMQFQQQKRMQDVQLAGQQLQFLQEANKQAMISQATQFMTDTGLGGMDLEDEDSYEDMKDLLTDDVDMEAGVNVGGYGMDPITASRMLSAVHSAQKGSPQSILNIANEVFSSVEKKKGTQTPKDKRLIKAFSTMGYFDDKDSAQRKLRDINKTVKNIADITQEMYEFGTGDYDITRDIGLYEPSAVAPPTSTATTNLANSIQRLTKSKTEEASSSASELQIAVEKQEAFLGELEIIESLLREETKSGKSLLTDNQRTLLVDKNETLKLLGDDIAELTEQYSTRRAQLASITAVDVDRKLKGYRQEFWWRPGKDVPDTDYLTDLFKSVDAEVLDMIAMGDPAGVMQETSVVGRLRGGLREQVGKISGLSGMKQLELVSLATDIRNRRTEGRVPTETWREESGYYKLFPEEKGNIKTFFPFAWGAGEGPGGQPLK